MHVLFAIPDAFMAVATIEADEAVASSVFV